MDYKILKHQEKAFYKGERLHILEYPGFLVLLIFFLRSRYILHG